MSTGVQAQELIEVSASEILKQIENGEDVYFENVRITGKLNLSTIELEKVPIARSDDEIRIYGLEEELKIVESTIEIYGSVFEGDVDFSNTQFFKNIDFSGTSFLGNIDFSGADFSGYYAYFMGADFSGSVNFRFANFSGDVSFADAVFSDDARFGVADFNGYTEFGGAVFSGDVSFPYANFTDVAFFYGADFSGDALFNCADFGGDTIFRATKFNGDADFRFTKFNGDADFWTADFGGDALFNRADFTGNATFSHTEFNKVTFTRATFTTVSLYESEFNQMNVEWSTLKDTLVFDGHTYIKLIKNFREMEQFEDADAAYYQYRQLSQKNKKWSFSKLMDVVAGASCGYGVKPERALIWAFVLIMVFTLVYWRGKGIKRLKGNNGDKNRVSRWTAFYNSFYFSVVTFTTVGYGDWYPEDRYRIVVMIEGVLGWLLLALFIVTLANVMIRP
jgi:uncharacterized protein YjbI with pentapeptide repeats